MESQNNDSPQETVKGNWECAECGTKITELPFEPAPDRPIYCKDCWSKKRDQGRRNLGPRKMFQGDWECAECGTKIIELPFEPAPDQPILCRDCWIKKREEK